MVQLFERRVLTYTPSNPAGFQVEMGNIGAHYFQFRYLGPDASLLPATVAPGTSGTPRPPRPTATPRPTAAPITGGPGPVRIVGLVARPPDGAADLNGETVTLRNDGQTTVSLARWTLADASGKNVFTFPALSLTPGGTLTIHSGRGTNTPTDLYWGKTVSIWRDTGDTATLRDATGSTITTYTYG
jgi:competence protein ComEC